jgi:hypothetical protein
VGAENPSGHREQGFRATRSDPCAMPRPSECAGAPTNEPLAKAANAVKRFDPRLRCQDARTTNRAHERQDHSGRSRSSGGPSHHDHRCGETAGQRSGRVFGTHRIPGTSFRHPQVDGTWWRRCRRGVTRIASILWSLSHKPLGVHTYAVLGAEPHESPGHPSAKRIVMRTPQAPHVQRTRPNALNRHRLQRALARHRRSQRNSAVSDRDDLDQVLHGTQIVRVARIER